ncbi:hypothetical protein [Labrys neptuniae]
MAMSSYRKSLAATIFALAVPPDGFKKCCLKGGNFDGSDRSDYFRD